MSELGNENNLVWPGMSAGIKIILPGVRMYLEPAKVISFTRQHPKGVVISTDAQLKLRPDDIHTAVVENQRGNLLVTTQEGEFVVVDTGYRSRKL